MNSRSARNGRLSLPPRQACSAGPGASSVNGDAGGTDAAACWFFHIKSHVEHIGTEAGPTHGARAELMGWRGGVDLHFPKEAVRAGVKPAFSQLNVYQVERKNSCAFLRVG